MMYLLGMAADGNDVAKTAVSKVDKFLALALCPWSGRSPGMTDDLDETRAYTSEKLVPFRDEYPDYFWGEGGDIEKSKEANCGILPEEMQAGCKEGMKEYAPYLDSMSN